MYILADLNRAPLHQDAKEQGSNGPMLNRKLRDEEDLFVFGDGHKKDKSKKAAKAHHKVPYIYIV
jgi:hypothetical protein